MESGLDGRNNHDVGSDRGTAEGVSMESGLDGRNNRPGNPARPAAYGVSMESGLDGRNNSMSRVTRSMCVCLNGVRPRWPEQCQELAGAGHEIVFVSMESGLDGRNNIRKETS